MPCTRIYYGNGGITGMKYSKHILIFVLSLFILAVCTFAWRNLSSGNNTSEPAVITENTLVNINQADYELWKDSGDAKLVPEESGAYTCTWQDTHNVVFRAGRKFFKLKPVSSFGEIRLTYGVDFSSSGQSIVGVYGWTKNPLVEFYITENWGKVRPDDTFADAYNQYEYIGTYTVDGAEYDVYTALRENAPSIEGDTTFIQYWSIRRDPSTEGTITVSDHFKIWEDAGMPLGDVYEIAFAVEGVESSGSAHVYRNELTWAKQ